MFGAARVLVEARTPTEAGGLDPMFLIRTAFWLALVVLLLPTDPRAQSDLMAKVSYAAHQAVTYCDRNHATCQRAKDAWG